MANMMAGVLRGTPWYLVHYLYTMTPPFSDIRVINFCSELQTFCPTDSKTRHAPCIILFLELINDIIIAVAMGRYYITIPMARSPTLLLMLGLPGGTTADGDCDIGGL